jgi:hypothetical protein
LFLDKEQEFFKEYGFMSCYECDKIFLTKEKLDEHLEECIDDTPHLNT